MDFDPQAEFAAVRPGVSAGEICTFAVKNPLQIITLRISRLELRSIWVQKSGKCHCALRSHK